MKALIVCSYRNYAKNGIAPFIKEQVDDINKSNIDVDYFIIKHKGIIGYLKSYFLLINKIKQYKPDIIHAHFGLSGLLANLQRNIPVVTTYHGSDININKVFFLSKIAIFLSKKNIFVSQKLYNKVKRQHKNVILPCGVNTDLFIPLDKNECRKKMKLDNDKKYVLFSKMFTDPIKNYQLAKESIEKYKDIYSDKIELLEFIGYSREEVVLLMNAVDCVIMTSHYEGSPQFIKEAMACGCPIVSVDVGDVPYIIGDTNGCYIVDRDSDKLCDSLKSAIEYGRTNGRDRVINLFDSKKITSEICRLYKNIINQ